MGKEKKGVIRVQKFDYCHLPITIRLKNKRHDKGLSSNQNWPSKQSMPQVIYPRSTWARNIETQAKSILNCTWEQNHMLYNWNEWISTKKMGTSATDKHTKPDDIFVWLDSPPKFGSWENNAASTTQTAPTISQPLSLFLTFWYCCCNIFKVRRKLKHY